MQHEEGASECRGEAGIRRAREGCRNSQEEGALFAAVTAEEQAAIRQFLNDPQVPGAEAGRAAALARAALKFAGMLLLAAGVLAGYADGNEFDEVGCSVALSRAGHRGARIRLSPERLAAARSRVPEVVLLPAPAVVDPVASRDAKCRMVRAGLARSAVRLPR